MGLEFIEHDGRKYPSWQGSGNAARWIMTLAKEVCDPDGRKTGLDVGCNREEWAFPGALRVDPILNKHHAMDLPGGDNFWDYLFSSHMLEHLKGNWYDCLDYWLTKVKEGGIIFLYLPHASQSYWHPSSNRKHVHSFSGDEIGEYLRNLGHKVYVSGVDHNNSFVVICEKLESGDRLRDCAEMAKIIMYADEKEKYCQERGIPYIREDNNVIYNEPVIEYRTPILNTTLEEIDKEVWEKFNIERMKRNQSPLDFSVYQDLLNKERRNLFPKGGII